MKKPEKVVGVVGLEEAKESQSGSKSDHSVDDFARFEITNRIPKSRSVSQHRVDLKTKLKQNDVYDVSTI